MEYAHLKLFLALVFFASIGTAHAQETISSAGGDISGAGGSIAFTIGQVAYKKVTGDNGAALQGVQQAYEIFTVSNSEVIVDIKLSAYPNPTSDLITLYVKDFNHSGLVYQLFDLKGALHGSHPITSSETALSLSYLPVGSYLLSIIHENRVLQTFKIIKNK